MSRTKQTTSRSLSSENVANVLTFLSWQQPLQGSTPGREEAEAVECGRSVLLDFLAGCLREDLGS
jgi:hypothetical protein